MSALETLTPIQSFYEGKTLFVTGATGFLGKVLLEKCLRTFNVKRIYILVRTKRGQSAETRLEQLLKSPVYDQLRQINPNFGDKITIITGDCQSPNAGIRPEDVKTLIKETNCIFHCAATINFDEHIALAAKINVRATRDLLQIAKQMPNLLSFVHVSTAYANSTRRQVDEVVYDPAMLPDKLFALVENIDHSLLTEVTERLLGGYANTYVFTKNIAEHVVQQECSDLPISIIRPSIVTAAEKEPIPGYVDNLIGITGLCVAIGLGFVRSIMWRTDYVLDAIPLDYVVNETLAVGWDIDRKRKSGQNNTFSVFNCVTSSLNPIKLGEYYEKCSQFALSMTVQKRLWYPFVINTHSEILLAAYGFLLHTVPYHFIDFIVKIIGGKPILVKSYNKFLKLRKVLKFFVVNEWYFTATNTTKLYNSMSEEDKKLYNFDVKKINWNEIIFNSIRGIKKYILMDNSGDFDDQQTIKKLKTLHYTLVTVLLVAFLYIVFSVFNWFL